MILKTTTTQHWLLRCVQQTTQQYKRVYKVCSNRYKKIVYQEVEYDAPEVNTVWGAKFSEERSEVNIKAKFNNI